MMRSWTTLVLIGLSCLAFAQRGTAAEAVPIREDIVKYLDSLREDLVSVNQDIWNFAELGLRCI